MKEKPAVETRIVETALRMFNENGIEYVGMRELAAALGMRIGNLNYYFPTKDHLVNRLGLELAEENSRTIVVRSDISMASFFEMLEQVFQNHLKYRCLFLSFVHVMQRNPLMAKRYSKTQTDRSMAWLQNIQALRTAKELQATDEEVSFLVSTLSLVARFWISEATISFRKESVDEQTGHYLAMLARIFLPYATAKSRRYLNKRIAGDGS